MATALKLIPFAILLSLITHRHPWPAQVVLGFLAGAILARTELAWRHHRRAI